MLRLTHGSLAAMEGSCWEVIWGVGAETGACEAGKGGPVGWISAGWSRGYGRTNLTSKPLTMLQQTTGPLQDDLRASGPLTWQVGQDGCRFRQEKRHAPQNV